MTKGAKVASTKTSFEGRKPFKFIEDQNDFELSPSMKEAYAGARKLEKLMASLNDKFKSTYKGSTASSTFLNLKPVEISKGEKAKLQDKAKSPVEKPSRPLFPRIPKSKPVNLILAYAGFEDQVRDLLTRLSSRTQEHCGDSELKKLVTTWEP